MLLGIFCMISDPSQDDISGNGSEIAHDKPEEISSRMCILDYIPVMQ
jgi:hypothetical protein